MLALLHAAARLALAFLVCLALVAMVLWPYLLWAFRGHIPHDWMLR